MLGLSSSGVIIILKTLFHSLFWCYSKKMFTRNLAQFLVSSTSKNVSKRGKVIWARKPLGSPMAKTKMFKIPVHPVIAEDERAETKRLYDNYRTQIKSLR